MDIDYGSNVDFNADQYDLDSYAEWDTDDDGFRRAPGYLDEGEGGLSGMPGYDPGSYIDAPQAGMFVDTWTFRVEAWCRCKGQDDCFLASTQFRFTRTGGATVTPIGAGKLRQGKYGDEVVMPGNPEDTTYQQGDTRESQWHASAEYWSDYWY